MSYLDPSILRLAPQRQPRERATLHVPRWRDFEPGERIEVYTHDVDLRAHSPSAIGTRWATVVSWDRPSGELVVDYDAGTGYDQLERALWRDGRTPQANPGKPRTRAGCRCRLAR